MVEFTFELDDGYAGGSRPHSIDIDESDMEDMTAEQQEEYVSDVIWDNLSNYITICNVKRSKE